MIKFKLNGLEVETEEGTTILKAAQELGIDIPTFCYHPAIEPYQVCRVCLVEMKKDGKVKLVPSCGYKVEEGTEVITDSERVIKRRKMIVELILAEAPNSEKVREIAKKLGIEKSRFQPKKEKECTLCGLCVRVCNEIMGIGTISFAHRGGEREVTTPYNEFNDICSTCGACAQVCPTGVIKLEEITKNKITPIPSSFNVNMSSRPCIYVPYAQAVPNKPVIDRENCMYFKSGKCKICEAVCQPGAIDYNMEDTLSEIEVGSVVVATGVDYLDPAEASEYGYKRFKNIYTSFELERIMSEDGPTRGELELNKELKGPLRFAFIQCVGSRNMRRDINYCSRICCMNTIKDSLVLKEHYPDAEIVVFYIDIRAFGKGFEEFYNRSVEKGVKYIKGKPSKVYEDENGDLIIHYEDEQGQSNTMTFDAVCLSSALIPPKGFKELAGVLGVETDDDGFFKNAEPAIEPLESTREGILVCGCATGPKDITDSIAEASGAAVKAACFLKGHEVEIEKPDIKPVDVSGPPRVGVFVCHCGPNISKVVDVKAVVEYTKTLPGVAFAEDYSFACSETSQRQMQERIAEHKLNRVVVAACTPKTHEPTFQDSLAAIGLNPYLFDIANIRNQCSWVHQKEPEKATEKAKELIRMSVARVRELKPLIMKELPVNRDVAIIGGGITGLRCGIDLLTRGFKVKIIEKNDVPGGLVGNLSSIYPSFRRGKEIVDKLIEEFTKGGGDLKTSAELVDVTGYVGNFQVKLSLKGEETEFTVGAIVLATGSALYKPGDRYGYSRFPNVITNMELEQKILSGDIKDLKSVAFVQCVGSRGDGDGNQGCSRYCCQAAIKEAIHLREKGIDVTVLNRGVRVYSKGAERMYRKARELGVLFLPYEGMPEITGTNKAEQITVPSPDIDADITIPVDLIMLSVGMVPAEDSLRLSELFKVPRGPDKFFLERHSKFGPVETTVEGVFLCGCCQFPQDIGDSISQASAVASKVAALLSRDKITLAPITSAVDEVYCRGCGRCAEVCEFHAIEIIEKEKGIFVARVNEALCKGCGTCVTACPTGAIDLRHFMSEQIEAQLEALFG